MILDDELRKLLQKACDKAGSQRKWALENGVTPTYVNDVLRGKRAPGKSIAKVLIPDHPVQLRGWAKKSEKPKPVKMDYSDN